MLYRCALPQELRGQTDPVPPAHQAFLQRAEKRTALLQGDEIARQLERGYLYQRQNADCKDQHPQQQPGAVSGAGSGKPGGHDLSRAGCQPSETVCGHALQIQNPFRPQIRLGTGAGSACLRGAGAVADRYRENRLRGSVSVRGNRGSGAPGRDPGIYPRGKARNIVRACRGSCLSDAGRGRNGGAAERECFLGIGQRCAEAGAGRGSPRGEPAGGRTCKGSAGGSA